MPDDADAPTEPSGTPTLTAASGTMTPTAPSTAVVATLAEQPTLVDLTPKPASLKTHSRVKTASSPDDGVPPPSALPPMSRAADAYLGCTIDERYVVEALVGEGGMGHVYRARRKVIDKAVAIKILRADMAQDPEVVERFVTEARAASAIGNAHIVDVVDVGELPDGSTYFVMEHLEGATLTRLMREQKPLAEARLLDLARQIADGLAAAHDAGIIHRDLKPDNLFVVQRDDAEFVKILDFGIAKVAGIQNRQTRAGTVFGTPHYMSPEQARGAPVDLRTDIYALGVILYELAAGRVPFDGESPLAVLSQHMMEPPPALDALTPDHGRSAGLEAVIQRCLAKEPDDRYADMRALAADLEEVARGAEPDAQRKAPRKPAPRAARSGSSWGLGVAGIAIAGAVVYVASRPAPAPALAPSVAATPAPRSSSKGPSLATPEGRPVALVLSPVDAEVFRGDRLLGAMPVTVHVKSGERVTVEVRRDGFYSESVLLDGSAPRVVVRLQPVPGARPKIPVPIAPPNLDEFDTTAFADPGPSAATASPSGAPAPSQAAPPAPSVAAAPTGDNPYVDPPPTPSGALPAHTGPSPEVPPLAKPSSSE